MKIKKTAISESLGRMDKDYYLSVSSVTSMLEGEERLIAVATGNNYENRSYAGRVVKELRGQGMTVGLLVDYNLKNLEWYLITGE